MRRFALLLLFVTLPAGAEVVAITGATVHTMGTQGTVTDATVVIRDGKIETVARGAVVPEGARRIDGRGKIVTPGLFDSLTRIGLVEVSSVTGTRDDAAGEDRITAAFDVRYGINPDSMLIPVNRIDGLTRAVVAPGAGTSLIGGQGAVIHLGGSEGMIVKGPAAMFASLGEQGASRAGGTRGAAMLRLREALEDARDFSRNYERYEQGNRREYALSRLDLQALGPVLRGQLPLVIHANRASDLLGALELAREFNLRVMLAGATEGWKVAREISSAGVPVLINPLENLPSNFENLGATLENAARLHAAGVTVVFATGDSHNARNIRQAAGNAVAYGMPWQAALAAMTSVPARVWGIQQQYGTLEPGRDADVVIWDGDPLELSSYPAAVFIRGVEMPMTSRQTELRDRYANPAETYGP
ncbi:MAG: amidohydrolase family protein [Thermoanaerobaculia bacterium]